MLTATSRDGTQIAFWRSGNGPALLLVHGAIADHSTTWRLVLPLLNERWTVYAMDRRGRGASGDGPQYGIQREAEDVTAVIDAIGEPVTVLAHSFGALAALEAALLTPRVVRLILYEGVALRGAETYRPGIIEQLEALLAAGEVEEVLVVMLRDVAAMEPSDIDRLRAQRDAWAVRLRNAPTIPRELRAEQAFVFEAARYSSLRCPVTLLVGGDSPQRELVNARGVAAVLANAGVVVLPGQQHIAMYAAPEEFVAAIG